MTSQPSQSIGENAVPSWEIDRCVECGTTEDLFTLDVTRHPPLCPKCGDLWYGPKPDDEDFDCRSVAQ